MPAPWKVKVSQAFTIIMWTGLAVMMFGDSIFQSLNMPPPELYLKAKQNQVGNFGRSRRRWLCLGSYNVAADDCNYEHLVSRFNRRSKPAEDRRV